MLFFEGGPVFALSVCFLDGDNIFFVEEFLYCFLLAFLRISGRPSAVRRPLAFHVANESVVASLGRIRFVSSLLVEVVLGGRWLGGVFGGCAALLGVFGVRLSMGFWFDLVPLAGGCGGQASDQGGETG